MPFSMPATRLLSATLVALAVGCAHMETAPSSMGSDGVRVGDSLVELRFASGDSRVAEQVKRILPRAIAAAERWGSLDGPVIITIHPSHDSLEAATLHFGQAWMRGWARRGMIDLQSPRTWSRGYASDDALTQILAHELTHCMVFQAAGNTLQREAIPIWFQEGIASVTAQERHARPRVAALTPGAVYADHDRKLFYDAADGAFRYLLFRYGEDRIRGVLFRLSEGRPFSSAFRDTFGVDLVDFESDLRSYLESMVSPT